MGRGTDRTHDEADLQAFSMEVEGSGWRALPLNFPTSAMVCLRIERRIDDISDALDVIEICRSTMTRAIASARKHIRAESRQKMMVGRSATRRSCRAAT